MKINKKNIIIPTLMLSVGLGLVGSITGTVAWYQYSTRVQAALLGTSVGGNNKALEINVNNKGWKTDYRTADLATALDNKTGLAPLTSGELTKDAALPTITENAGTENEVTKVALRKNPSYQNFNTTDWKLGKAGEDYVQFTLAFHARNVDDSSYIDKDIYLSKVEINDVTANKDLANAVRIHLATANKKVLIAKSATSTNVSGYLDLNADGNNDTAQVFEWNDNVATYYGDYEMVDDDNDPSTDPVYQSKVQTSYASNDATLVKNPDSVSDAQVDTLVSFGKTGTTVAGLSMTVTVWLEGWEKLGSASPSAMWNSPTYIGETLQIGLQFAIRD